MQERPSRNEAKERIKEKMKEIGQERATIEEKMDGKKRRNRKKKKEEKTKSNGGRQLIKIGLLACCTEYSRA
jgi:hypothetical protein